MIASVFYIDTFTAIPFTGNPTAVCLLQEDRAAGHLHAIAREINLPVTAFVIRAMHNGCYPIRYFTITGEIPACGHATLAAAKLLSMTGPVKEPVFVTKEGITIRATTENDTTYLEYPIYTTVDLIPDHQLLAGIGISAFKEISFCRELESVFIELDNPALLRTIQPNYRQLLQSGNQVKEVVITSVSDDPAYDFLLRSFCPWIGIDEDPVTGSVHSVLAHFWKSRLGKSSLKAWQASERGGEVFVRALDHKVLLGGKTALVLKGELFV